jgi:hypothetical protein
MVVGSDIDVTRVAYLTVGLHDVQTGDLALEGTSHVDVGTIGELLSFEVLYGTDELGLLEGTVTDDH